MRFLADAGVARRIVAWLRTQGHDATHLQEQGLQRLPDQEVFAKASAERRVVLTFDLDFGEIVALSAPPSASVILFRLHDTSTRAAPYGHRPHAGSHRGPLSSVPSDHTPPIRGGLR